MPSRTWLITGVSSGFGRELTEQLLAAGDRVVGTVRDTAKVADLTGQHPSTFIPELLEMTDTTAIRQLIDRCWQQLGRIDVIISNAGYGLFGAAEELSDVQIADIIATNLTGPITLIRSAQRMLDPANGLAPGDLARTAARIIDSADTDPAPLRLVLGSQALQTTIDTLRTRIADFETQTELAASTDFPPGQ